MALLWVDGFENYGTTIGSAPSPADIIAKKYISYYESYIDIQTGRDTGYCTLFNYGSIYITTPGLTTDRTLIIGAAIKIKVATGTGYVYTLLDINNSVKGMRLFYDGIGELKVYNNTTLINGTSGLSLSAGVWYYIEFKVYCDNTVGTYEVRVGGVNVLSGTADTQYTSTLNYYSKVRLGVSTAYLSYDDLYICDSTGTVNNNFLGNCKVETLRPAGDSVVTWTPDTGVINYTQIDEQVIDDDTTYVEATTGKDLYTYGNTANTSIQGVMITTDVRQTDATDYTLNNVTKSGVTEISDNKFVGATGYTAKTTVVEQDPNTSTPWTQSTLNAAEFGVEAI